MAEHVQNCNDILNRQSAEALSRFMKRNHTLVVLLSTVAFRLMNDTNCRRKKWKFPLSYTQIWQRDWQQMNKNKRKRLRKNALLKKSEFKSNCH